MSRAVVTGATSMLGAACIEALINNRTEVLAIIRPGTKRRNRLPDSELISIIECDIDKMDQLSTLDIQYDLFFHFAWTGTSHADRNNPTEQNRNIGYVLQAIELAKRLGCRRFIGVGSQAEYGPATERLSPGSAVRPILAYGIAKYCAGRLGALLCSQIALEFIWVRVFSVYGPYDNDFTFINRLLEQLQAGKIMPMTAGDQLWDYLYSEDAGEAFRLIGDNGRDQAIYCLGSGKAYPLKEYVEIIGSAYHKDISDCLGKIPYPNGQIENLQADIQTLTEDTGFLPRISFDDGIRRTIAWKRGKRE